MDVCVKKISVLNQYAVISGRLPPDFRQTVDKKPPQQTKDAAFLNPLNLLFIRRELIFLPEILIFKFLILC